MPQIPRGGLRLPQIQQSDRDTISISGNTTTAPGLTIYNTDSKSLEYWDGSNWVKAAETEPWMQAGTSSKAYLNNQNIYQLGMVGLGQNNPQHQLHVTAAADPVRFDGLKSGATADSLVTANTTGILKMRSVHALRQDIVAAPVGAEVPFKGMLRFNTTTNLLEYYDGSAWQSIASNIFGGKNEGIVKIDGSNSNPNTKPVLSFSNADLGIYKYVDYTLPLARPFAYWPENITGTPTDANIVGVSSNPLHLGHTTFRENSIIGQVHTWRINARFDNKPSGTGGFITVRLTNPVSGFILQQYVPCQTSTTTAEFTINFITVADPASLPAPLGTGNGYVIMLTTDVRLDITIQSITRVSAYKD